MRFILFPVILSCLALLSSSAPVPALSDAHEIIARSASNPAIRSIAQAVPRLYERSDAEISIKLGSEEFHLKKHHAQGESGSEVYTVTSGPHAGAFAKKKISEQEIEATTAVGDAIASGKDQSGGRWLVIKKSPGVEIEHTSKYINAKSDTTKCQEVVAGAIHVAVEQIVAVAKAHEWLHDDPHTSNILFNDQITQAHLIDWGKAKHTGAANAAALKLLLEQQFSHLCKSAAPPPPPPKKKAGKRAYELMY
ncbi:uncharacterized protein B0H18DRAFT_1112245 [Fomitopsis serialis]|uniref:uncharacterized protein n=1 Tax=Fomitopsis serialis TaxID=139415 RepID=UPI002008A41F|nr:uncharacterized protein B0H18DRAFT_1112245 [Neoantrodia serialis]KAH9938050.1 hypothetical protein B0H18DRAFT_1112245 [Neoantrodia serialis]